MESLNQTLEEYGLPINGLLWIIILFILMKKVFK